MIGILPCAGEAKRIHGLPKYLLPCPPNDFLLNCHFSSMIDAGCDTVFMGANPDNFMSLTLQMKDKDAIPYQADKYRTMTETVLWGKEHGNGIDSVLFGMPDTYFDVAPYQQLSSMFEVQQCDLLIGLFNPRPNQHKQGGMVHIQYGEIVEVVDKPETISRGEWYIWGAMAWRPSFWECLESDMSHVGFGIQKAIDKGLTVHTTVCLGGFYDCGTPERYFEMIRETTREKSVV